MGSLFSFLIFFTKSKTFNSNLPTFTKNVQTQRIPDLYQALKTCSQTSFNFSFSGYYTLTGNQNGWPVYIQKEGGNVIYFLGAYEAYAGYDWWYIGEFEGYNSGGMKNNDKTNICPDQLEDDWQVWSWTGDYENGHMWVVDQNITITCEED